MTTRLDIAIREIKERVTKKERKVQGKRRPSERDQMQRQERIRRGN